MPSTVETYVREIQAIGAVPKILETVAALTGLGFVAVAHVTPASWTTCAVLDKLAFGLKAGDGLDVATTLCEEVRSLGKSIVIDHVQESEQYRDHHTPRIYGFQSYFSIPIFRPDGAYFGTLCGLDPQPAVLSTPATVATLELFAELISRQLESERLHAATRNALLSERETAELREQFIAVMGHDLRTPLSVVQHGIQILAHAPAPGTATVLQRMQRSVDRMSTMVDDVVDFTRGRLGGGIALDLRREDDIAPHFRAVIDELRQLHPDNPIHVALPDRISLVCDPGRLAQLLSNLIKNAVVHGSRGTPVSVTATTAADGFVLRVSNEGGPLPAEVQQKLFQPFWRSPSAAPQEGLGLGLYIVSEIARSHGGKMAVAAAGGSVAFTFSMPNMVEDAA